jgi:hypothetical protein
MFARIRGWWATFQVWRHDREAYDFLANYEYDPDDFGEVQRPT